MSSSTNNSEIVRLAEAIASLRSEVARLGERTAALEKQFAERPQIAARETDKTHSTELDEETISAISAAIAAYLGHKPRIRQIVLLQSHPWSQQGRVTIQASRDLVVHYG
jgi:methylmalonyl-CoA carboxyltransferase 12S subunit